MNPAERISKIGREIADMRSSLDNFLNTVVRPSYIKNLQLRSTSSIRNEGLFDIINAAKSIDLEVNTSTSYSFIPRYCVLTGKQLFFKKCIVVELAFKKLKIRLYADSKQYVYAMLR